MLIAEQVICDYIKNGRTKLVVQKLKERRSRSNVFI